ncbi:ABC transporter permease [Caldalkalibacillus mannanilyticus]|uniref:ABC transporter permease n=1 Tax=Caldalkalibacillus mannanilyticus TaxID=1418 RepID=UPI000468DC47|nr:ABC transporter permease subunit [Caldalkalibacillus mannanilyticus]
MIGNNPILNKELRLRMRSKRSPLAIALYLLVLGSIVFSFIFLEMGNSQYFNPDHSKTLFITLSILQFTLISFVTPGLTAGLISGERERQTLPMLLTTNLSATAIIIGKWLSSLSFILFLIVTTLPLYGIVLLYGGISPIEMLKIFAMYLVSMFAIGSFGLMFSTLFKRSGVATVVTYGVIISYTFFTFLAGGILTNVLWHSRQNTIAAGQSFPIWPDLLFSINPLAAILYVFGEGPLADRYHGAPSSLPFDAYWIFLLFFALLTVIALVLAIYFLKPVKPRLFRR